MFELIEKIRNKPEGVKKQIAFLVAFLITGIIFTIWVSVIFPNWKMGKEKEKKVVTDEPTPLSTMMDTFFTSAGVVSNQVGEVKALFSNLINFDTTPIATTSSESFEKEEPLEIISTTTERE